MSPRVDVEHAGAGLYNVWSTVDSVRRVECWNEDIETASDTAVTLGIDQGIDVFLGGGTYLMRGDS